MLKNIAFTITFGNTHRQDLHKKVIQVCRKEFESKIFTACPFKEKNFYKSSVKNTAV